MLRRGVVTAPGSATAWSIATSRPTARCSQRDAAAVANVVLVLVLALLAWYVVSAVRRHRRGLVAERGTSIGADLGALADQPRVRVRALAQTGPDRVRLVLARDTGPGDAQCATTPPDLEVIVNLRPDEFGFSLLREWELSQAVLAIVMPPASRIVRLRAIDDLQPLTLRRVDNGPP
jgi:hypothetical protein